MDESIQFIVYTNSKIRCPYCIRAKSVLTENNYTFEERDISDPIVKDELLTRRPTVKTIPQIFLTNDTYIGGCDELTAMVKTGELALLLEI